MKFNTILKLFSYKKYSVRIQKLKILNLDKNSSEADIKKAYIKMVKEVHPDINQEKNASEQFKKIQDAYQYLSSNPQEDNKTEKKSKQYQKQNRNYYQEFEDLSDDEDYEEFQNINFNEYFFGDFGFDFDIFEKRQRQRQRARRQNQNRDYQSKVNISLKLTLKESIDGGVKEIKYQRLENCDCQNTVTSRCNKCKGKGFRIYREANQKVEIHCLSCKGTGQKNSKCENCKGKKLKKEWVHEYIQIPKNISQDDVLQIKGMGDYYQKSKKKGYYQDLYIKIQIIPDKNFTKKGNQFLSKTIITPCQAVLCESLEIRTLKGTKKIKLKNPIQNDQIYEFSQKVGKNQQINYKTKFKIKIPTQLSCEQKELYQKLMDIDTKQQEYNS